MRRRLVTVGAFPSLLNVMTLLMLTGEDEGRQTNRWCQDCKGAGVNQEFPGAAIGCHLLHLLLLLLLWPFIVILDRQGHFAQP